MTLAQCWVKRWICALLVQVTRDAFCLIKERVTWDISRILLAFNSTEERKKTVNNLHEQFGHASSK